MCLEAKEEAWENRWSDFTDEERASDLNGISMMLDGELDLKEFTIEIRAICRTH